MTTKPPNLPSEHEHVWEDKGSPGCPSYECSVCGMDPTDLCPSSPSVDATRLLAILGEFRDDMPGDAVKALQNFADDMRAPVPPSVDVEREARELLADYYRRTAPGSGMAEQVLSPNWEQGSTEGERQFLATIAQALSSRPHPEPELPGEVMAIVVRLLSTTCVQLDPERQGVRNVNPDGPEAAAVLTRLAGDKGEREACK